MIVYLTVGFGADDGLLYVYVFDTEDKAKAFIAGVTDIDDGVTLWEVVSDVLYSSSDDGVVFHKNWVEL